MYFAPKYMMYEFRKVVGLPEPRWDRESRGRVGQEERRATVTSGFAATSEWLPSTYEAEAKAALGWLLMAYSRYGATADDFRDLTRAVERHDRERERARLERRDSAQGSAVSCPACGCEGSLEDFRDHYQACLDTEVERRVGERTVAIRRQEEERTAELVESRMTTVRDDLDKRGAELVGEREAADRAAAEALAEAERLREALVEAERELRERRLQCGRCRREVRLTDWSDHVAECRALG